MLTVLKLVEWMKDVAEIAPTKTYNPKDLWFVASFCG